MLENTGYGQIDRYIPNGITESANEMISLCLKEPQKQTVGRPKGPKVDCLIFVTGNGGLGKIIMSTAVLRDIIASKKDVDVHVVTPHPDVFLSFPGVTKVWDVRFTQGFWELIKKTYNNPLFHQAEPYFHRDYIAGKTHLVNAWRDLLGLKHSQNVLPELYLSDKELKEGKEIVQRVGGPVVLLQITGGSVKVKNTDKGAMYAQAPMFNRNLSPKIAKEVIDELGTDYKFIQIAKTGQPLIHGCTHLVDAPIRTLFAVIANVQVVCCIDSFVQHAAAALGKKAIVLWGATNPATLGYACHNNLYRIACPDYLCGRPNSYLMDTSPSGQAWVCPYGTPCLEHDTQNIIDAVKEF